MAPFVGPDVYGDDMNGRLSLVQGTAICLGAVLGTGVIGLPALGADIAGPASLLAWAGLIVLSIPLAATFAALGAKIVSGRALQPTTTATSVRGGDAVTDGPFAETKEALGGFYLIEAKDLDQALEVGKLCPAEFGGVEVRPIMVFE